jgi:hypothetical protein
MSRWSGAARAAPSDPSVHARESAFHQARGGQVQTRAWSGAQHVRIRRAGADVILDDTLDRLAQRRRRSRLHRSSGPPGGLGAFSLP